MTDPEALIDGLLARAAAARDPDWDLAELPGWIDDALTRLDAAAFVAWVRESPEHGWAVHEVASKACAKPRELAALLLREIVVETADERAWERSR